MIVYLHGFNSSPRSHKAQFLKKYLEDRGRGDKYVCPQLPHRPLEAIKTIEAEMSRLPPDQITLLGSSLGGFYATYLSEKHGVRAALINPAIDPHIGLRAYLGPQQDYHGGGVYELNEAHLSEWKRLYVPGLHPDRYLLLVETGDEVLDYRLAVDRYRGAKQVVVHGGDHAFASFPEHIPLILEFAGMR